MRVLLKWTFVTASVLLASIRIGAIEEQWSRIVLLGTVAGLSALVFECLERILNQREGRKGMRTRRKWLLPAFLLVLVAAAGYTVFAGKYATIETWAPCCGR